MATENNTTSQNLALQYIKGVGPKRAEALAAEGILTPRDLLYYFPRTYIDRNAVSSLKTLSVKLRQESIFDDFNTKTFSLKQEITVVARVTNKHEHVFGNRKKMLSLTLSDGSGGSAQIVFWNYTDYYDKTYPIGQLVTVSGKAELDRVGKITFNHPEIDKFEPEDEELYQMGNILPVYVITEKMRAVHVNTRVLRRIMSLVLPAELPNVKEILPQELLSKLDFPNIQKSIQALHFPSSREEINNANRRMKFEEIFLFEIFLAIRKRGITVLEKGIVMSPKSPRARKLYESLPFKLTDDQKKVIREITNDIQSGKPMNRLLQGDVGSGKTIVALLSMLVAVDNGYQVAFMAPTEILAEQHFNTLTNYLKDTDINVVQLMGGQKTRARREILEQIATGSANIIVGTHALFESEIEYNKIGMVVIDEQHRFGVAQRAELKALGQKSHGEADLVPHILVMSATPIPRTISLTLYGDLDVSIIKQMPKNRKPIKTRVVFEKQLDLVFDFIKKEIQKGHQAYIVYPLVEKSDKLELKAATEHYEYLREQVFPEFKCGLLHGQLFWYEKEESMKAFLAKEYDILVATTVIEVGIDVPNATVMLINNAERFGLAQLHQLRGRVGRGGEQSYCILATKENYRFEFNRKGIRDDEQKAAIIRLKTMEDTTDGFAISEVDLKLRGPGDVLGTRQSGLPNFKFVDLASDGDIITLARKEAFGIIESDPKLARPENLALKKEFIRQYRDGNTYFSIA